MIHSASRDDEHPVCRVIAGEIAANVDGELNERFTLTSANSINVARFLPQAFYYFNAWARLQEKGLLKDALKVCAEEIKINLSFAKTYDVISNLGEYPEDDEGEEIGFDFSGVDKPKNEEDYYGLRYSEFVVPLTIPKTFLTRSPTSDSLNGRSKGIAPATLAS